MKKSIIWLLTIVMSITFCALLYFQIMYLENMVKMRDEQFSEGVMRSLNATSEYLEKQETLYFLEQDVNIIGTGLYETSVSESPEINTKENILGFPSPTQGLNGRYGDMQEVIRRQYLYQRGLLSDVILSILRDSGTRPVAERADSAVIKECLKTELFNNGLNVPFTFALYSSGGNELYSTEGYKVKNTDTYTIPLFANTDVQYRLNVQFPTKNKYIFSSVRFIIPTLFFSLILLMVFVYTIMVIFRQKKLTEMKTDFINNMTHELKTPIATISLASQMLGDSEVRKSPDSIKHISSILDEETKRLRFQVEKVLHLSVLDNAESTLKLTTENANEIISNVVNTFKLKVERSGGTLTAELKAQNPDVDVDRLQFTNVIHNLLENALKYMRDDVEPDLSISTRNEGEQLVIEVKDNGIGINREDQKRIFEKFYRVSTGNVHNVKGFGLGLAYVKKMITAFRGSINVESEPGIGSTFIIRLPLSEK